MNLSTGMHACEIDRFRGMRAASIRKDLEDWKIPKRPLRLTSGALLLRTAATRYT